MVPAALRPQGILELFMMGGLSPWDSFYVVPEHGRPERGGPYAGQQWWTYQDGEDSVPEVFARCGGGSADLLQPFGTDADGRTVHLGPWLLPLRERPDIVARMRIVVLAHDLEPHEAAVPLCVTGHRRGSPRLASTGAHVQRFHREHAGPRVAPYSYVLFPNSDTVGNFNVEGAAALGTHPGTARPLAIQLRADNPLPQQLRRAELGGHERAVDAAVDWYRQQFAGGFAPPDAPAARSVGLTRYADARAALAGSPQLAELLTDDVLATFGGQACGHAGDLDPTGVGLRVGTHLLTSPADAARFVHLVDVGLKEGSNGGYDTHDHHVRDASISVTNLSRQVADRINRPGENDPGKLDLDRHMVVLSTEMGRTPYPQLYSTRGLNHWPYGFVVALIGGPIDASRAGVVGAIGPDGRASRGFSPAEFRAALLLAQGIWPFARESFDVSDVPDGDQVAAALRLRSQLLGIG